MPKKIRQFVKKALTQEEISKYEKMINELNDKINRIQQEFMDGEIAAKSFEKELHYLEKEIKNIKIAELMDLKQNNEHKQV